MIGREYTDPFFGPVIANGELRELFFEAEIHCFANRKAGGDGDNAVRWFCDIRDGGGVEADGVVEGTVIEAVKGGLIVDIGLRGFLPASLVEMRRVRDLSPYIGQKIKAKILELDKGSAYTYTGNYSSFLEQKEARIERVGVFPFSPEEGTPAAKMEHVDEEEAQRRADLIMELQAPIMDEFCQGFCGKTIRVLCEGYDGEAGMLYGRSYADSPDIDGQVFFKGSCRDGDMTSVRILEADDGILYGEEI